MPVGGVVGNAGAQPLLQVDGVCVSFGGLSVLTDVCLDVDAGSVLGVIGPNGAGKTTLFNVICGFIRPSAGELRLDGALLRRHRPHDLPKLGVARTLQGLGLFPRLSVLDNVLAGATRFSRTEPVGALLGSPWADRDERRLRERATAVMDMFDLAADAHRTCASLPYGVRKRVALARALVGEPRLLLLDEPAAGLSSADTANIADIIRGLRERTTVMLVEHHIDFVMGLCERIVVLDFGEVIARGTPAQVRGDPAVQRAYLGELVGAAHKTAHSIDA